MVKVENKETLRLLTKRFMKMNRARNIIAVIAIMLTSLLFTSLFVGSVSMILSKRATEIKQFMDSSHAIAQNLSEEDAERLQKTIEQDEDVERYGSGIFLGAGMDERFGFSVEVRYADENMAESFNCLPTTGRLLPRWQFNHDPDPRYYHLDALQGTYTITTREVCTELTQAVNTLTQRMSYPSCAAEVTVDASALKEGDVAGLCALQGCYAAVGITKRHGKYEVLMLDKKEDGILDMTEGTVVESHQMDFRLEADFCNMKDEARCYYRVNKGDWLPIGTVHKLYFKLDHFTGCRFGLFCYAAEETGGSACFRDFKYYDVDEIS